MSRARKPKRSKTTKTAPAPEKNWDAETQTKAALTTADRETAARKASLVGQVVKAHSMLQEVFKAMEKTQHPTKMPQAPTGRPLYSVDGQDEVVTYKFYLGGIPPDVVDLGPLALMIGRILDEVGWQDLPAIEVNPDDGRKGTFEVRVVF